MFDSRQNKENFQISLLYRQKKELEIIKTVV